MFLIFNFHFVVEYLICFYMWLRVLRSWKVVIYSDGNNIIIIIIIGFFRFKLVLLWLRWYYVGCVGISLVALVFPWWCWYFVGGVGISLVVIPSPNVDGK